MRVLAALAAVSFTGMLLNFVIVVIIIKWMMLESFLYYKVCYPYGEYEWGGKGRDPQTHAANL